MSSQWTKERNRLSIESVKGIVTLQFNFKSFSCLDFHKYLLQPDNKKLVLSIGNSNKYL